MIIVIGMDNTGKTTLCNELAEALNTEVINSFGPVIKGRNTLEDQKGWAIDMMTRAIVNDSERLHERFPIIEEMVYGKVLRDDGVYSLDCHEFKLLKKVNPLIIYCRPSKDTIFDFGERSQMEGVVEHREKLLLEYDDLAFQLMTKGYKIIPYNYKENDISLIEGLLNTHKILESMGGLI